LTDFGVAHVVNKNRVTEASAIVGTVQYLSPEALNSEEIDPRADVWSFGVMLFEMLTGQLPFQGNGFFEIILSILRDPLPDLEKLSPTTPLALVDLVYRMLVRDRQARISSVRHVGAALEDILQGRVDGRGDARTNEQTDAPAAHERRFDTPVPATGYVRKHNLPVQMTPFVGREAELDELDRMLDQPATRLVTVVAPGGMGKTRLTLEAAQRQIANFEHGVYVVELAPLNDSDHIIFALANAVGYPFQSDSAAPKQQLFEFLKSRQLLLVMDNYEHLLDSSGLALEFLQAAPGLKILVSSRQRLDQPGETLFHLSGMNLPDWETTAEALDYAAVRLFMNSAVRARPDFELNTGNLTDVARICRFVQGMPIGIVLAASWLGMLTPAEVVNELEHGLDFLESDSQQLPERHRNIRKIMDYSWAQMSEAEQQVFMKLTVFRGGFTREAAQEVAEAPLRLLMSLVNLSLLHRNASSGRYENHELLRQYAEEASEQAGTLAGSRARHTAYFAKFMADRDTDLQGRRQIGALTEIDNDFENIKNAWRYACESQDAASIDKMLDPVYLYCGFRSRKVEGFDLFELARNTWSATDETASLLAERLLVRFQDPDPKIDLMPIYERGLAIARRHGDQREIALGLRQIGYRYSHILSNHETGIPLLEESASLLEQLGDRFHLAVVLDDVGWSYRSIGKRSIQIERVQRSVDLRHEVGDKIGLANALRNMGGALGGLILGTVEPLYKWQEALEISKEIGDKRNIAWNNYMVGAYWVYDGEHEKSLPYRQEAAIVSQQIQENTVYQSCQLLQAIDAIVLNEDYATAEKLINEAYPPGSSPDARASFYATAHILLTCSKEDFPALRQLALRTYETTQAGRDFVWRWIVVMGGLLLIR
ncbi:MAG TPA: protein kinase, partial [Phototrophicaceae bacterium]|nr:protein kinase [Phototrophicaceae bacterium]